MKAIILTVSLLLGVAQAETLTDGPFSGLDTSTLSEQESKTITEANGDYSLVLKGSPPEFAKLEENKIHSRGDPRRHHLLVFLGDGYTIAVHKLPVTLGENEGLIFGPQLNFHHVH